MERSSALVVSAICDELGRVGAGSDSTAAAALVRTVGPLLEWVLINEGGPVDPEGAIPLRPPPRGPAAAEPLRPEDVTEYLRTRFDEPAAEALEVREMSGGFSRRTTLVTCLLHGRRQEVVLRQMLPGQVDEKLVPEYEVITFAFANGLLAPEPLWIEPAPNALGGPFFATRRRAGKNPGDVFGADGALVPSRVGEDLARFLAELHTLDATSLSATPGRPMLQEADVRRAIDACSGRLASATDEAVPVARDLFAWLGAKVPPPTERAVIVHGDVGLHNLLVDGDRVSVVLDWERAHLGDPTEDLVYLRPTLDGVLDWDAFMAAYLAAGGMNPGPDRERFYRVWQDVWRYVACMEQLASFELSGRLSSAFAGRIYGPRFLASAAAAAFGDPRRGGG